MSSTRKMIGSGSRRMLAACVLSLGLAAPSAASSGDLAARFHHLPVPSRCLEGDLPEIVILKPPPPPPPPAV